MWSVARRPRWIGVLFLALAIAAAFAGLAQWQIDRSIETATVIVYPTETVLPIESVAKPQKPVTARASGQLVSVHGSRVPGDLSLVSGRDNNGRTGYWVVGHVVADSGASVALAIGWAQSKQRADAAAERLRGGTGTTTIVGRYLPSEAPQEADFEHGERNTVSVAALINEWKTPPAVVYGGYVVARDAPTGLTTIYSPKPSNDVSLNWLNVFYAIEWIVFAGFAFYFWYRLVKDAWEREEEEKREREEELELAELLRNTHVN